MDAITKIPPELLSHILEETTLLDPDCPLTLSLVCRYFHRVTITSPRVWRQLHIALSSESESGSPQGDLDAVRKAELWFSRSGTCDIAIDITSTGTGTDAPDSIDPFKPPACNVGELPSIIRREKGRVESLTLRFPTEAQARFFLSAIYPAPSPCSLFESAYMDYVYCDVDCLPRLDDATPNLRSLSINISTPAPFTRLSPPPTPSHSPSPIPYLALSQGLNLTHLHLANCTDTLPLSFSFAHLQQLTIHNHLRAQPIPLNDLVGILKKTTDLRILDLEARISISSTPLPSLPPSTHTPSPSSSNANALVLPHLTSLTLRANNIPSILDCIIPPALHTLSVDDLDGNRPDAARELGESLRRVLVRMDMPVSQAKVHTVDSASSFSLDSTTNSSFIPSSHPSFTSPASSSPTTKGIQSLTLRNTSFPPILLTHWVPVWEWCIRRMRGLRRAEVPWIVGDLIAAASKVDVDPPPQRPSEVDGGYGGEGRVGDGERAGEEDGDGGMQDNEIPCAGLETVIMTRCPVEVVRRFKSLRPGVVVVV